MTATALANIVIANNLRVARVEQTTGNDRGAFHRIEIVRPDHLGRLSGGTLGIMIRVAQEIRLKWNVSPEFCKATTVTDPGHPDRGVPYVLIESFWSSHESMEILEDCYTAELIEERTNAKRDALVSAAAEATEMISQDELEEFARNLVHNQRAEDERLYNQEIGSQLKAR